MFVIYGGTFDMPHHGHRQTFDWLMRQGHDPIVVPAIGHEFKAYTFNTYLYRKAMCRRVFGDYMHPLEEEVFESKPAPIMAIDVLRLARALLKRRAFFVNPCDRVGFAIGPDVDVSRWTGIDEIQREGFEFVRCPEAANPRSSLIREMITTGKPWETHVPPCVAGFIKTHGLYGWKDRS